MWRRLGREKWQTLNEALDNPDGERLYAVELEQSRKRQAERQAAEREAQRPVCTQCATKFTDERWQSTRQSSWRSETDGLCGPCSTEHFARIEAERVAQREAEEAAARKAPKLTRRRTVPPPVAAGKPKGPLGKPPSDGGLPTPAGIGRVSDWSPRPLGLVAVVLEFMRCRRYCSQGGPVGVIAEGVT
ncbi:hypothetical protein ACFW17_35465 [Streptomyces sp. NPDC058961]|uniref:hypothetical protein n=1 Tax=Streptomyces sp. NPDC058961 TaxID=3346680 RepID=UPI003693274E